MAILNDIIIDRRNDRIISLEDFKDEVKYDFEADNDSGVCLAFCEYIDDIYSASEIFCMDDDEIESLIDNFLYEYIENINSYDEEIFFIEKCYLQVDVND